VSKGESWAVKAFVAVYSFGAKNMNAIKFVRQATGLKAMLIKKIMVHACIRMSIAAYVKTGKTGQKFAGNMTVTMTSYYKLF